MRVILAQPCLSTDGAGAIEIVKHALAESGQQVFVRHHVRRNQSFGNHRANKGAQGRSEMQTALRAASVGAASRQSIAAGSDATLRSLVVVRAVSIDVDVCQDFSWRRATPATTLGGLIDTGEFCLPTSWQPKPALQVGR